VSKTAAFSFERGEEEREQREDPCGVVRQIKEKGPSVQRQASGIGTDFRAWSGRRKRKKVRTTVIVTSLKTNTL